MDDPLLRHVRDACAPLSPHPAPSSAADGILLPKLELNEYLRRLREFGRNPGALLGKQSPLLGGSRP